VSLGPCLAIFIGNWNETPKAQGQAALFRYWNDKTRPLLPVQPMRMIEFIVACPPLTQEASIALARDQFLYCPDIVVQGAGRRAKLAVTLLGASVWYFW
jgi:hypothetical protein